MTTKFDLSKFTTPAKKVLERAQSLASTLRHDNVDAEHTLTAILEREGDDNLALQALQELDVDTKRLGRKLIDELELMPKGYQRRSQVLVGRALLDTLEDAGKESKDFGDDYVTLGHVLIAMSTARKGYAGKLLRESGATAEKLREALKTMRKGKKVTTSGGAGSDTLKQYATDMTQLAADGELQRIIGRDQELRRIIQVLSRKTKNNPVVLGAPGVGKTAIVEALAQRLVADDVPVGLRGKKLMSLDVGALVAGTSLRGQFEQRVKTVIDEIIASDGQIILFIDELHTIVGAGGDGSSDAAGLLKPALARGLISLIGTTTVEEYRQSIEKDPALERRFQPILVEEPDVDGCVSILRGIKQAYEIHHNVQITDQALIAATKMTARYIPDRALPDKAIDAIDEAASRLRIEIDSKPTELDELERRATGLEIERGALENETGLDADDARTRIATELESINERAATLRGQWEREKGILDDVTGKKEEYEAAQKEMEEAQRKGELGRAAELKYSVLPKIKAEIDRVNDEHNALLAGPRLLKDYVDETDIAAVIGDWTGIPVSKMVESEREKLLLMPERLKERVIGQDMAVDIISTKVQTSRAGLQDPNRPIGNFLFVGPTGVGKTELAKAIAEFLFDDEDAIVRIDMSEYMEQSKVNTLIGSAKGYVGSESGGVLTEAVRTKPYSVVLFDEAEKAHPDVFNILLQVMDEGRLSDSQGRRIDFTNTLVILTSNVGSQRIMEITQQEEFSQEELDETIEMVLRENFRPEFLNRLDDKIAFRALDLGDITKIAKIQERKTQKLLDEQRMTLDLAPEALLFLAENGFEPEYGARPLKRSFAEHLQQPLAIEILEGKFVEGDTIRVTVGIDEDGDDLLHFENPNDPDDESE